MQTKHSLYTISEYYHRFTKLDPALITFTKIGDNVQAQHKCTNITSYLYEQANEQK